MVAGGREVWATDRKRVMELSQHCWFCSALIKLCWRATDRLRAPIENSRELLIKAVSSQRSCPSIRYFLKGTVLPLNRQSAVFLNVTNPPKKVKVCRFITPSITFYITLQNLWGNFHIALLQHDTTLRHSDWSNRKCRRRTAERLRFSELQVPENKQQTHKQSHTHTNTHTQGCNPQNPPKQKAPDHLSRRRHQQTNNNFCFPSCWTRVRNSSRVCLIPSEPQMSPSKTLKEQFQQLCFNFLSFWRCWLADCDLRTQPG